MVGEGKGQKECPARTMTVLESLRPQQLDFYLSHEDIGECCKRKGEMAKSQQNMPSSNESFTVRLPMQMCRENLQVGAKEGITPKLTSIQPGGGWH